MLAIPLAIRLAVPPPEQALLGNAQAVDFADALVAALQSEDVPVIASATPLPLDWLVEITAERQGRADVGVRPRFRLLDADRKLQATTDGNPVPLEDWANADRKLFDRVAQETGPKLTQLLLQVEAARKSTDPASLTAGPPRMYMVGVQGAPGDGNASLAARMQEQLGGQGFVVQDNAEGASLRPAGRCRRGPRRDPRGGARRDHLDRQPAGRRGARPRRADERDPDRPAQPALGRHRLCRGERGGGRA